MRASPQRASITGPPYLRGFWSADRIAFTMLLCLLPPLGITVADKGMSFAIAAGFSVLVAVSWQVVFASVRKRRLGWDGISTGIMFALIAGEAVPLWQITLAVTFGIVVGEQIFGGRGYNFLNPAVVALAFLTFSFAGTTFSEPAPWFVIATVPSALLLVATRLISWRMIVGIVGGLVLMGLVRGQSSQMELTNGSFMFIVVFLACDPVSSSSTNLGRWANGLLIVGLAWAFTPAGAIPSGPETLIPAILLASVFAPLIDTLVVMLNTYARRLQDV